MRGVRCASLVASLAATTAQWRSVCSMAGVSNRSRHEIQPKRSSRLPTSRQLRYLRILAERTGTTFTTPGTCTAASREIERLKRLSGQPGKHEDQLAQLAGDRERLRLSTAVYAHEISGYGSTATWRTNHE